MKSRVRWGTNSPTAPTASQAAAAARQAESLPSAPNSLTCWRPAPPAAPSPPRRICACATRPRPQWSSSAPVLEIPSLQAFRLISSETASSFPSPTSPPTAQTSPPTLNSGARSPSALGKSSPTPMASRSRTPPAPISPTSAGLLSPPSPREPMKTSTTAAMPAKSSPTNPDR